MGTILKATEQDCCKKAEQLVKENKDLAKEIGDMKSKMAQDMAAEQISQVKEVKGIQYLVVHFENTNVDEIRGIGDKFRDKLDCGIVILTNVADEKITVLSMATKSAIAKGVHAGNILKGIINALGGSGGGRPDMAQGGLKDKNKIIEIEKVLLELLSK